jgi:hypothetical protein
VARCLQASCGWGWLVTVKGRQLGEVDELLLVCSQGPFSRATLLVQPVPG